MLRCMRAIDFDRVLKVCEKNPCNSSIISNHRQVYSNCHVQVCENLSDSSSIKFDNDENQIAATTEHAELLTNYVCKLSSLQPLTCSPKNNVIIGRCIL